MNGAATQDLVAIGRYLRARVPGAGKLLLVGMEPELLQAGAGPHRPLTLSRSLAPLLPEEAAAFDATLAADLLGELERLDALPAHYDILDLSADLRERQQATLAAAVPHLLSRVRWLDRLPARFSGVVIGNELLDAMPADVVAWRENGICERGVSVDPDGSFYRRIASIASRAS